MERTFKCLDEAFNLPYSILQNFEETDDYTEISTSFTLKHKREKKENIKSKEQIIEIKNKQETYYKKPKREYNNFNIDEYIDNFIKELLKEQREYSSTISKNEYQLIRERFISFIKSLDKHIILSTSELKEDSIKLRNNHIKLQKDKKIKNQIIDQKSNIINKTRQSSYNKIKASSWRF